MFWNTPGKYLLQCKTSRDILGPKPAGRLRNVYLLTIMHCCILDIIRS